MRHTCWSSPPTLRLTWPWTVAWPGSCSPTTGNATWTPRTCTACPPPWWVCSQSVWRGLHKGDREGCCFVSLFSIFQKHILQTYNFNKFTALVNFNKTEQSTALTCANASRSEVSKILRPTRLQSPFFRILTLVRNFSKLSLPRLFACLNAFSCSIWLTD